MAATAKIKRNALIERAYRRIGVEFPTPLEMNRAAELLNLIVKEMDSEGRYLWAISQDPKVLTLTGGDNSYAVGDGPGGIPADIAELEAVYLVKGTQRQEVAILDASQAISTPFRTNSPGEPVEVYLEKAPDPANSKLRVYPTPSAGFQLEIFYRRSLWGFDDPTDNPDFPEDWGLRLIKRLEKELAPEFGADANTRLLLKAEADEAERKGKAAASESAQPQRRPSKYY